MKLTALRERVGRGGLASRGGKEVLPAVFPKGQSGTAWEAIPKG